MDNRLTPSTVLLLVIPPLMWAGNAVIGRVLSELIPPLTLNFARWVLAFIILIPLGRAAFARGSGLLSNWRRYATLGLLGVGLYNGLQYMALHTSTPVNVTLVGASMPVWMLVIGALFFRTPISKTQLWGSLLSFTGVLLVLAQGDWRQLIDFRFVTGDMIMLVATIIWAFYSWLLVDGSDSPQIRAGWAAFLLAQVLYGLIWSGAFVTLEWAVTDWVIHWNRTVVLALVFVSIGPALIAFWCWGSAVQRVGPSMAGLFYNLTPMFAAILSALLLGEAPRPYHAAAFFLIVGGIAVSTRGSKPVLSKG